MAGGGGVGAEGGAAGAVAGAAFEGAGCCSVDEAAPDAEALSACSGLRDVSVEADWEDVGESTAGVELDKSESAKRS